MRLTFAVALCFLTFPVFASSINTMFQDEKFLPKQQLPMSELMPVSSQQMTSAIQGHTSFSMNRKSSRVKLVSTGKLISDGRELIPNISFDWVQNDTGEIIPFKRHLIISDNPYWDYILGAGVIWPSEDGEESTRISMPFALIEKNENCVHNGVIVFEIGKAESEEQIYYQISSETCAYFKADFWGKGKAVTKTSKTNYTAKIAADYKNQKEHELATRSIDTLTEFAATLVIQSLALPNKIASEDMTVFGVARDNVHYVSECQTRMGSYPFCDQMVLPSYSTAKSLFAGVAMFYLQKQYGDVFQQPISKWVKQCSGKQWKGVTFEHLLDMNTGNYDSSGYSADEASANKLAFFNAKTNNKRLDFACNHYARNSQPGETFVYHTSDTYLLGVGLNAYVKAKLGNQADVFKDVLFKHIFQPLDLSQISAVSRRTPDKQQQPYVGYGLFFNRDDLVRLSRFLQQQLHANPASRLLAETPLSEALQRDSAQPGMPTDYSYVRYQHGFWARNAGEQTGCKNAQWIPLMSGYGGITIALLADESSYYYVSDSHEYDWSEAIPELNKLNLTCVSMLSKTMRQSAQEK